MSDRLSGQELLPSSLRSKPFQGELQADYECQKAYDLQCGTHGDGPKSALLGLWGLATWMACAFLKLFGFLARPTPAVRTA